MFMGEDYGERRPFCFFAGFEGELAQLVTEGRRREFEEFAAFTVSAAESIPDPIARSTFEASRLDWDYAVSAEGRAHLAFVQGLIGLRARHVVPRLAATGGHAGRVLRAELGAIAVDWRLGDALWQLRAGLSPDAVALPAAEGELISRVGTAGAAPFAEHWLKVPA